MEKIIDGKDLKGMKFVLTDDGCLKEYKPKERFIPEPNEKYWFINYAGEVVWATNDGAKYDNYTINHQLVFETEEECQDYKWFLEQLDKYKANFTKEEWEDRDIAKYYIRYNYVSQKPLCECNWIKQIANCIYFSKDDIDKFIETVDEDRIKKYMFDIWE